MTSYSFYLETTEAHRVGTLQKFGFPIFLVKFTQANTTIHEMFRIASVVQSAVHVLYLLSSDSHLITFFEHCLIITTPYKCFKSCAIA